MGKAKGPRRSDRGTNFTDALIDQLDKAKTALLRIYERPMGYPTAHKIAAEALGLPSKLTGRKLDD